MVAHMRTKSRIFNRNDIEAKIEMLIMATLFLLGDVHYRGEKCKIYRNTLAVMMSECMAMSKSDEMMHSM
jgi:hypothetical protein